MKSKLLLSKPMIIRLLIRTIYFATKNYTPLCTVGHNFLVTKPTWPPPCEIDLRYAILPNLGVLG